MRLDQQVEKIMNSDDFAQINQKMERFAVNPTTISRMAVEIELSYVKTAYGDGVHRYYNNLFERLRR